jgi:hypothetical protein
MMFGSAAIAFRSMLWPGTAADWVRSAQNRVASKGQEAVALRAISGHDVVAAM